MLRQIFGLKSPANSRISSLSDWHVGAAPQDCDMPALIAELYSAEHPALDHLLKQLQTIGLEEVMLDDRWHYYETFLPPRDVERSVDLLLQISSRYSFAVTLWKNVTTPEKYVKPFLDRCLRDLIVSEEMVASLARFQVISLLNNLTKIWENRFSIDGQWGYVLKNICQRAYDFKDLEMRDLLQKLFNTLSKCDNVFELMRRSQLADEIATITEFDRSKVAILVLVGAKSQSLKHIREKVEVAAGPELAPVMIALFDEPGPLRDGKSSKADSHPAIKALVQQGPDAMGRALVGLIRVIQQKEDFGLKDWCRLDRRQGRFDLAQRIYPDIQYGFGNVASSLLRRKLVLSDQDVSSIFQAAALFPELQSRYLLNQALKMSELHPGGATAKILLQFATIKDQPSKASLPSDWFPEIEQILNKNIPKAAREPLSEPPIALGWWDQPKVIAEHYSILLDARLYAPNQISFLTTKLSEWAATLLEVERHEAELATLIARHHDWDNMDYHQRGRLARVHFDFLDGGRTARGAKGVSAVIEPILKILAACEQFVTNNPEPAGELGVLAMAIRSKSAPAQKWLDQARGLVACRQSDDWIGLLQNMVAAIQPTPAIPLKNEHIIRSLIYLSVDWDPAIIAPLLTDFALKKCYQTEPGYGIKSEKLGNACLWALSNMPSGAGVPYLARILARVKYPKIRAKIDAALNEAAEKAGVTRAALDELTVPTHDLDGQGQVALDLSGGQAIVALSGNKDVEIRWLSPEGKSLKAPSAAMKEDKEAIKAAKALAKEIEADLATQIIRLQRLFLDDRSWPQEEWRARYLDHPLIRLLAQRLIWWIEKDGQRVSVIAHDDLLTDVSGTAVDGENAIIRLWHPIDDTVDAVLQWRDRIEALQIVQPFAQAWREIYRLTDAERTTGTYTNRWSGHILKQHQAMTLARINKWTVTHRMWVDAANDAPWHVVLPAHGMVADYWIEGAGGDDPEVLDSQAYVYVSTDRVAFHRIAEHHSGKDSAQGPDRSAVVPLDEIAPVVFSEIMRHCDLFTGVASIASDPQWIDRGGDAAHPNQWRRDAAEYWQRGGFAELTGSGKIRREMLQRIVPRLAIADRTTLEDNALLVQGKRHLYRIHLGSAAVHIADTNQHVCIVPASARGGLDGLWLPFEGDMTLSMILSKAALLAADDKITDPVILRQIERA